ncbi:hypothetical protein CY34DRAFT_149459 [Suillus luteus UH-Slu-Lm8-n1]|uniref:Uncharacterized protein n=1 Tax=Suillus luteus UH-Slu-Lm8-n1 TaxID=930992 RepID=A0A0D0ACK4_9AGAM|nr:hypothetical protein CY34DRAFT_149459 [Suillus luteus UH-Slu-Lm8-n1]
MFHPLVTKHDKYCSSIPVDCVCRVSCCPVTDQAEECVQIHIYFTISKESKKIIRTSSSSTQTRTDSHKRQNGLKAAFHSLSFSTSFVSTRATRTVSSTALSFQDRSDDVDSLTLAFSRFQFGLRQYRTRL